ncbi:hypothetical protein FRC12_003144 [Ceratobasidium sp. 428]|nr:hypothetical protein FRC12_003144 [Ceratobasidium sp. 428]
MIANVMISAPNVVALSTRAVINDGVEADWASPCVVGRVWKQISNVAHVGLFSPRDAHSFDGQRELRALTAFTPLNFPPSSATIHQGLQVLSVLDNRKRERQSLDENLVTCEEVWSVSSMWPISMEWRNGGARAHSIPIHGSWTNSLAYTRNLLDQVDPPVHATVLQRQGRNPPSTVDPNRRVLFRPRARGNVVCDPRFAGRKERSRGRAGMFGRNKLASND